MIQQGDLLLKRTDYLPIGARRRASNVLLEGEATGHAHRIDDPGVQGCKACTETPVAVSPKHEVYEVDNVLYLNVLQTVPLRHEEHAPIDVPPGVYRVDRVREYDHFEEETRVVAD